METGYMRKSAAELEKAAMDEMDRLRRENRDLKELV